jgi:hypothetical protein
MGWPLSQDYNEAIQNPHLCFTDAQLCAGQVATNALGLPMPRSGNFADVYEVRCPLTDGRWAVKCFTRQVPGLRERYAAISAHLRQANLLFTVEFQYLEQGIRVRGQWYPVLKMDWVEGQLLNEFVRASLDKPALLEGLLEVWAKMARRLRGAGLAHGDLQHGNIILVPATKKHAKLAVKLIDYDGMWVPALAGQRSGEVGHPAYQHPQRLREGTFGSEVDRFPVLVVYVAIRALMVGGRALWDRYDNGDNLLFREQDLRSPRDSALFWELVRLPDPEVRRLTDCLSRATYKPLEQAPLLDQLVGYGPAPAPPPVRRPTATATAVGEAFATTTRPAFPPADEVTPALEPALVRVREEALRKGAPWRRTLVAASLAGIGGGVCVLLCGLAFWAASLPGGPAKDAAGLTRWTVRVSTSDQSSLPKAVSPGRPATEKEPPATRREQATQTDVTPELRPLARWQFVSDARDSVGTLHGTLHGAAVVSNGRLRLPGEAAYMESAPLPQDITEKTLEVWVALANVTQQKRILMQIGDPSITAAWDGLLYAESQPGKWYPGSSYGHRSQNLAGPDEDSKPDKLVRLVIVYDSDNSITLYRNGRVYGAPFVPQGESGKVQTYRKGTSRVILGHDSRSLIGEVAEASLHDHALTAQEVAASFRRGPSAKIAPATSRPGGSGPRPTDSAEEPRAPREEAKPGPTPQPKPNDETQTLAAIKMDLDKARASYGTEVEKAKATLLVRYDEILRGFETAGNRQAGMAIREEIKVFRSDGIFSRDELGEAMMQYGRALKNARDRLAAAYTEAIPNYTRGQELNKAKELQAELKELAPEARLVSLESFGHRGHFISHANFLGRLHRPTGDGSRLNATFEIVPGLANSAYVSFRPVNVPQYYLAHGDFRIYLEARQKCGTGLNATFKQVKGLASGDATSFEAVNFPGYYIHARDDQLFIDKDDGSAKFRIEATFAVVEPQFKFW